MSGLSIIVEEQAVREGYLDASSQNKLKKKDIDTSVLKDSMAALSNNISEIFTDIKQIGNARLSQVQIAVEISAEGGISLIGTAKTGLSGAITLTFDLPKE